MKNGGRARALQARLLNLISARVDSTAQDQLSSQAVRHPQREREFGVYSYRVQERMWGI
jgi:hypothetical protein